MSQQAQFRSFSGFLSANLVTADLPGRSDDEVGNFSAPSLLSFLNAVGGRSDCDRLLYQVCKCKNLCFILQFADKREPGDGLPLAPEAHRAGRPVGAPQEDGPQIRAAQRSLPLGHAPLSGEGVNEVH